MTRISALWRLDGFLDRDDRLSADQRLALLGWNLELQDDPLPPPAFEVTDARGRSMRVAVVVCGAVSSASTPLRWVPRCPSLLLHGDHVLGPGHLGGERCLTLRQGQHHPADGSGELER